MLPFTRDVFLQSLAHINEAVWPTQLVAAALAALLIGLTVKPRRSACRLVAAALASLWLWTGAVYHLTYHSAINWAAPAFALVFFFQGGLLLWSGTIRGRFSVRFAPSLSCRAGLAVAIYALAVHPVIAPLAGHGWSQAPLFGAAPAPTALFTLAMLLLIDGRVPLHLLAAPLLWLLVESVTAWLLGLPEAIPTLLIGIGVLWLALGKNRRRSRTPSKPR